MFNKKTAENARFMTKNKAPHMEAPSKQDKAEHKS